MRKIVMSAVAVPAVLALAACGGKQPSDYAKGYCTIGDIMKQMAFALSTPFDSKTGNE